MLAIFSAVQELFAPKPKDTVALNRKAFLDMIAWSEGTSTIPNSDNGYRALVGGGTFSSYSAHPNQKVWIKRISDFSTAAGRYQIIYPQWSAYIVRLGLKSFSPQYQDAWAINALREVWALPDIDAGNFSAAVIKAGKRWASLPGSVFGQTIRTFDQVKESYVSAGGTFTA